MSDWIEELEKIPAYKRMGIEINDLKIKRLTGKEILREHWDFFYF